MRAMPKFQIVAIVLVAAIVFITLAVVIVNLATGTQHSQDKCTNAGGYVVRTWEGSICAKLERINY